MPITTSDITYFDALDDMSKKAEASVVEIANKCGSKEDKVLIEALLIMIKSVRTMALLSFKTQMKE